MWLDACELRFRIFKIDSVTTGSTVHVLHILPKSKFGWLYTKSKLITERLPSDLEHYSQSKQGGRVTLEAFPPSPSPGAGLRYEDMLLQNTVTEPKDTDTSCVELIAVFYRHAFRVTNLVCTMNPLVNQTPFGPCSLSVFRLLIVILVLASSAENHIPTWAKNEAPVTIIGGWSKEEHLVSISTKRKVFVRIRPSIPLQGSTPLPGCLCSSSSFINPSNARLGCISFFSID